MLRGITDFRVMKITTLKSNKSLIISVLLVAPLRSAVLPPFKSGGSTLESGYHTLESCYSTSEGPSTTESELSHRNPSCSTSGVGCSYLCNRVVPPLMILLPLYQFCPTAEGAPATESGYFYHCIRATPPLRTLLPPNPNCHTGPRVVLHQDPELFHLRPRVVPHQESGCPTT